MTPPSAPLTPEDLRELDRRSRDFLHKGEFVMVRPDELPALLRIAAEHEHLAKAAEILRDHGQWLSRTIQNAESPRIDAWLSADRSRVPNERRET